MKIRYTLTEADYIAFNRYLLQNDPSMRLRTRLLQAVSAMLILLLGALFCRFSLGGHFFPFILLFVLAAILFAVLMEALGKAALARRVKRQYAQSGKAARSARTLTISGGSTLLLETADGTDTIRPAQIRQVVRTERHLFILLHDQAVIAVPLAAWEFVDDAQNFYDALLRLGD